MTGARRRPGREAPTGGQAERDPDADPHEVARTIVLNRLTARARSRRELEEALAQRAVPDEVAEQVLDRMQQVGLVDDAAFAKSWVEQRQVSRGLSRRALSDELRRKGVEGETIERAVAEVDADAEYAAAVGLVERRARRNAGADRATRWRQLVGLLARRGYSSGLATRVVRDVLAREEENAHEPPHVEMLDPD